MIDERTAFEEEDDDADELFGQPHTSLDLSARMRELRARAGLKQSEVARRLGLDPSIPSLWEKGKRPVPANRVRSLANALGVAMDELLAGVAGAPPLARLVSEGPARQAVVELAPAERRFREHALDPRAPLLRLLRPADLEPATAEPPAPPEEPFVVAERPPLVGWIPDGWEPGERVQDISPSLPDGYWLDPVRLERRAAKQLLRSRLCAADRALVDEREVPGAALAARIHRHCSRQEGFAAGARLPLLEAIFRAVLASDQAGLTDEALFEALGERPGAAPLSSALLRRLGGSLGAYPLRWVDRDLFRGRR